MGNFYAMKCEIKKICNNFLDFVYLDMFFFFGTKGYARGNINGSSEKFLEFLS